jgi:hypothetical protein
MVDPECGARCAIQDTRAARPARYHWTITLIGKPDVVVGGHTADLTEAGSGTEAALATHFAHVGSPSLNADGFARQTAANGDADG